VANVCSLKVARPSDAVKRLKVSAAATELRGRGPQALAEEANPLEVIMATAEP
jgi:hypothetical protein